MFVWTMDLANQFNIFPYNPCYVLWPLITGAGLYHHAQMSISWTPCIWNSHGFHLSQEQTSLCIIYETIATDLGLVSLNIYQSQAFTWNSYVPSMTEQLLSYLQSYVMITILQFVQNQPLVSYFLLHHQRWNTSACFTKILSKFCFSQHSL